MLFSYSIFLIIVTIIVSLYAYEKRDVMDKLLFKPYNVAKHPKEFYRFISHAFIHADFIHLFFNMMVLYMFGEFVERTFIGEYGNKGLYYFVLLYFGGAVFSVLPRFILNRNDIFYSSLGASGAISAVVFAAIAYYPTEFPGGGGMGFMFLPISLPPIVFGMLYLGLEYYLSKRGGTNIGHDAHMFGALFGFAFVILIDIDHWHNFVYQLQHWDGH